MRLQGKVALVTGGGTGSGKASALIFANEGAKVAIVGRREAPAQAVVAEIRSRGGSAIFVKGDVSVASDCSRAVAQTVEQFGRLDIALNNAGVPQLGTPIIDLAEEEWDKTIAINLKGIFLCLKYEIRAMLRNGGGSIINMGSVSGLTAAGGSSAYTSSKHGLIGLTKSAAMECVTQNIRVNALCPGSFPSELLDKYLAAGKGPKIMAAHPMGRIAEPEEIARAALFLASSESSYITGVALPVDGGYTIP
jgi:NAD(P)-dependent dehydrogenase (short-subunit alcohol dehydrogenase family)